MADPKKPGTYKGPVPIDQYPQELRLLNALKITGIFNKANMPVAIADLESLALETEVQRRYAIVGREEYLQGAEPGLLDKLKTQESRLPPVKHPTNVGLFVMEDSHKLIQFQAGTDIVQSTQINHGYATATVADAIYRAVSGIDDKPAVKVNRLLLDGYALGKNRTIVGEHGAHFSLDLAGRDLRTLYDKNTANVYTSSEIGFNPALDSAESRKRLAAQLDAYYGDNAVFIVSAGNSAPNRTPQFRHNALHNHPSKTLVAGAVHQFDATVGNQTFPVSYVAPYSQCGADIVAPVPDLSTGYDVTDRSLNGYPREVPLRGTSFAAPHMGGAVRRLMERFVGGKENPGALLTSQHVLLAVKMTGQPAHAVVVETQQTTSDRRVHYIMGNGTLQPLLKINGRYVSPITGNGQLDVQEAWKLLEQMETRVRKTQAKEKFAAGEAKAYVRDQVMVENTFDPEKPAAVVTTEGLYEYSVKVDKALYADTILLDLHSPGLSETMRKEMYQNVVQTSSLYLVNPQGEKIALAPSLRCYEDAQHQYVLQSDYMVARVPAMQGTAMKGEWKIQSSAPLTAFSLNFPDAMQPDDVGVVVASKYARPEKELYRHADLRQVPASELDTRFFSGKEFSLKYDFSRTAFPEQYLKVRALALIARAEDFKKAGNDKEASRRVGYAKEMLATGYPAFNDPRIRQAIEKADTQALIAAFAPDAQSRHFLMEHTLSDRGNISREAIDLLYKALLTAVENERANPTSIQGGEHVSFHDVRAPVFSNPNKVGRERAIKTK